MLEPTVPCIPRELESLDERLERLAKARAATAKELRNRALAICAADSVRGLGVLTILGDDAFTFELRRPDAG